MGENVRSDQARLRVREEMERQKLSQREVADLLKWSQSRVAKILTGRVELGVDDLEGLCFAVGISLVEAVRDHGLEFCADMTPSELRMLKQIRKLTPHEMTAFMTFLDMKLHSRADVRRAVPPKKPRGPRE